MAGCIDAGEIRLEEPYNPRTGPFGFGSISFSTRTVVYPLKAGFGHRYGGGVDLLGNSCDFSAYSATRSAAARAAAGGTLSERIDPGTKAVSLRIRGSKGAPKVIVRGPDGTTITSPAQEAREAAQGPLPAGGEQEDQDDQRAAGQAGGGHVDRQGRSGREVQADQDRSFELRGAPRAVRSGALDRALPP